MEITEELLQLIEDRARAYGLARYSNDADRVILDNGSIRLETDSYCCGSTEIESDYIQASDLTKDLDEAVQERKLELEKKQKEERQRKIRLEKEALERKEREEKELYEKLKAKYK